MQYLILISALFISINSWGINPPTNTSPTNGITNQPTRVTLDWTAMVGSNGYIYEIDTSPNFNSVLYEQGATSMNSSSKTISNLNFGTTYYWRVATIGSIDTSIYGATWSFTTLDGVNNTSPTNGITNQPTTVTLDWSAMTGNNGYIYEIDTSPNFNSALYEGGLSGINSSQKTVSNLNFGTTYYWRAAILNTNDTSGYGAIWSFTTEYQLAVAPLLVSPIDASLNISTTSTQLVWDSIPSVSNYQIMYSTTTNFTSAVNVITTAQLGTMLLNLDGNTTYYWRVRGSNSTGYSPWSTVWHFTTETTITGISNLELEEITIYPNPVQELLYINLGIEANYKLNVMNLQGKMIDSYQFNASKIEYNTNKLVSGVYFIEVIRRDEVRSVKFIKK